MDDASEKREMRKRRQLAKALIAELAVVQPALKAAQERAAELFAAQRSWPSIEDTPPRTQAAEDSCDSDGVAADMRIVLMQEALECGGRVSDLLAEEARILKELAMVPKLRPQDLRLQIEVDALVARRKTYARSPSPSGSPHAGDSAVSPASAAVAVTGGVALHERVRRKKRGQGSEGSSPAATSPGKAAANPPPNNLPSPVPSTAEASSPAPNEGARPGSPGLTPNLGMVASLRIPPAQSGLKPGLEEPLLGEIVELDRQENTQRQVIETTEEDSAKVTRAAGAAPPVQSFVMSSKEKRLLRGHHNPPASDGVPAGDVTVFAIEAPGNTDLVLEELTRILADTAQPLIPERIKRAASPAKEETIIDGVQVSPQHIAAPASPLHPTQSRARTRIRKFLLKERSMSQSQLRRKERAEGELARVKRQQSERHAAWLASERSRQQADQAGIDELKAGLMEELKKKKAEASFVVGDMADVPKARKKQLERARVECVVQDLQQQKRDQHQHLTKYTKELRTSARKCVALSAKGSAMLRTLSDRNQKYRWLLTKLQADHEWLVQVFAGRQRGEFESDVQRENMARLEEEFTSLEHQFEEDRMQILNKVEARRQGVENSQLLFSTDGVAEPPPPNASSGQALYKAGGYSWERGNGRFERDAEISVLGYHVRSIAENTLRWTHMTALRIADLESVYAQLHVLLDDQLTNNISLLREIREYRLKIKSHYAIPTQSSGFSVVS